jgi:hypothetical protein
MAEKKNFPLRLQQETFEALQRWADDEFRSLNGQIEFLLTQSLKKAGRDKPKKKSNLQEE